MAIRRLRDQAGASPLEPIGYVDVDAYHGDLLLDDSQAEKLMVNAKWFVCSVSNSLCLINNVTSMDSLIFTKLFDWLASYDPLLLQNEDDVETKFVIPMFNFLGYPENCRRGKFPIAAYMPGKQVT